MDKKEIKNINTFQEFAEFLNENDLIYSGNAPHPFSRLEDSWELSGFMTIEYVEKIYDVKLNILEGVV